MHSRDNDARIRWCNRYIITMRTDGQQAMREGKYYENTRNLSLQ